MRLLNTGDSGVNGTQVSGFSFTDGTITGAGDASDENSITFDDSLTRTPNLTGVVTITNNVISQTEAEGIDIENWAGTISDANISSNALSDTGDVATPGSAITLIGSGTATSAANITRATVANNTITDFRAGVGVQVRAGNPNAGGSDGQRGDRGQRDERDRGHRQLHERRERRDRQPARPVLHRWRLRERRSGQLQRLEQRHGGEPAPQHRLHRDRDADRRPGHDDLDGAEQLHQRQQRGRLRRDRGRHRRPATTSAPAPTRRTISGNNVMGTDGPGIFPIVRDSGSTMIARVLNNTVAAPIATNAARAGIRVDSGSAQGDTTLCLEISGNTTAGSTNTDTATTSPGINLRKQGTDPNVNTFGIEGMAATASPGVENYVNGLNTSTSGTFGVGGTALLSAQSGFTNCNAP